MGEQIKLIITPASGWRGNATLRLRALCKAMLRSYGWRIVRMEDVDAQDAPAPADGNSLTRSAPVQ